jgi:hypothetical protein
VTLAAFAACTVDIVFGAWPINEKRNLQSFILRGFRPLVALLLLCFALPAAWKELPTRHTNADLVATQIQGVAQEGDLVLVPRWECAISFCRYYHGKAEVMTIPPIPDHRFHRYDLVWRQMRTPDAQQPVLDRMEQTLRSGHRIFLADMPLVTPADVTLPALPLPYQDPHGGWHGAPYNAVWQATAERFLRAHAARVGKVQISLPPGSKVQEFEDLHPRVVEGWH